MLFSFEIFYQLYPDSNHNLDDVKYHFYKSMESFLLDSFKLSEDQDLVELQASLKSAAFEKWWKQTV